MSVLSLIIQGLNHLTTAYIGHDYLPPHTLDALLILCLIRLGLALLYPHQHEVIQRCEHLICLFLTMVAIANFTNAVQLTPFKPYDHAFIQFEGLGSEHYRMIYDEVLKHPLLRILCTYAYQGLDDEMIYLPLWMIFFNHGLSLRKYCCALLLSALIGFCTYYFFPTTAPASQWQHALLTQEQYATGLKFLNIHHYQVLSTSAGGLIAFPSFHVIWSLLCLQLAMTTRYLIYPLYLFNTLLILSCVLLGWHYWIDIIAGIGIVLLTTFLLDWWLTL